MRLSTTLGKIGLPVELEPGFGPSIEKNTNKRNNRRRKRSRENNENCGGGNKTLRRENNKIVEEGIKH